MAGCRVGWPSGTAKSRACVPARGPRNPSFTPCVDEASCGASDAWGTWSEPDPVPEEVASASLLRAVRVFAFNLSIGARSVCICGCVATTCSTVSSYSTQFRRRGWLGVCVPGMKLLQK